MSKLIFLESVKKMPAMSLPIRSTYVPLHTGAILISPGSALELAQLKSLPSVTDLVAPNLLHCAGIMKASSIFPKAQKWGVVSAKELKPEISWTDELLQKNWPYKNELPMIQLQGIPKINEVVFFHKESKSLIITDLCFNLLDSKGIGSWIILNLFGTYKKFATSRFFMKFVTDKEAFEKSLGEIFSFDFENVVLSHGENITGAGKAKLLQALKERDLEPK